MTPPVPPAQPLAAARLAACAPRSPAARRQDLRHARAARPFIGRPLRTTLGAWILSALTIAAGALPSHAASGPALPAAPIDAAGAYQHLLTLTPARTTAPSPPTPPVRFMAYGRTAAGGLLLLGDSELLSLNRHGALEPQRYRKHTHAWPAMGTLGVEPTGAVVWCGQQDKRLHRLNPTTGDAPAISKSTAFSPTCQVFKAAAPGWVVTQPWPAMARSVSPKGALGPPMPLKRSFLVGSRGQALTPCGMSKTGRALATQVTPDRQGVELVELDDAMKAKRVLWRFRKEGTPLAWTRLATNQGCAVAGKRVVLWFPAQVLVFEGDRLVTALRNGTPFSRRASHAQRGMGPYAFNVIAVAQVLGDGDVLAVAERDKGELKLYARRVPVPTAGALKRARSLAAQGRAALAEQAFQVWTKAHPRDCKARVAQLQARLRAGWWSAVTTPEGDACAAAVAPVVRRARARLLERWSARSARYGVAGMARVPVPAPLLSGLLAELEAIRRASPDIAAAHAAEARLAAEAGQSSRRLRALDRLAGLVRAGKARGADWPELFDLYAARGDRKAVAALVSALKGSARLTARGRRWRAIALQLRGDFKGALTVLGPRTSDPESMRLRATLLVDAGQLDEGIMAWTRAVEGPLRKDASAHNGLGVAYLRKGLMELAAQRFLKAVELDPAATAPRSNLVLVYTRLSKRDAAMQQVFGALAKAPKDPLLRFQLAQLNKRHAHASPGAGMGSGGLGMAGAPRAGGTRATARRRRRAGGSQGPGGLARPAPPRRPTPALRPVAVLPLSTAGSQRAGLGEMVAAMLTTAVVQRGTPPVVERGRLESVLREQRLQHSRHFDRKTAVRVGKLAGAHLLLTGNVAEFAGRLAIDLRLVHVKTGAVRAAVSADAKLDLAALRAALSRGVAQLWSAKK